MAGDGVALKVEALHGMEARGLGLLGTALAQAVVAAIGFAIAGVPAVPLLAVLTFVSSLVPVGPPIIWGGAAIWLFSNGSSGWVTRTWACREGSVYTNPSRDAFHKSR